MRILIASLSTLVLGLVVAVSPKSQSADGGPQRHWVKIVFGMDGETAKWDGNVSIQDGRLLNIAPWCLELRDEVDPQNFDWKITTGLLTARRCTFSEPMRGVLLEVESTDETQIDVRTEQGDFRVRPNELKAGRPTLYLQQRASVEPLGSARQVAQSRTDDDFASIAVDTQGHRHVAWIAYDAEAETNHLLIRDVDDEQSRPESIATGREFASPHLFVNRDGDLHAVWCSPGDGENWDVYTTARSGQRWQTQRLTTAEGGDFHLAAAQGAHGTLWLSWQSFRNGSGDIYAKCLKNGRWSDDIPVAVGPANCWQPAVSVDRDGRGWVAYDSYENGNYDVFLTDVDWDGQDHRLGQRIAVAQSPDFEAHASVLAGNDGRVWVAYDAAGPNWGKDFRNRETITNGTYAEPLHATRRLELRCVVDGEVQRPAVPLPQKRPPDRLHVIDRRSKSLVTRFYEYPQLARDGEGRMWLLFRLCLQGYCPHPPGGIDWSIYATTFTDQGWLEPIQLPQSRGRQDQRVAATVGADNRLHCAWAEGNRFASVNRKYSVVCGRLPAIDERAASLPCEPVSLDPPGSPDPLPDIPTIMAHNDQEYHLYFGDLHRHTNISRCSPTIDGCLTDAHRYALDAVQLDFLAITDHTRDVDPFSWWRTQQAADLFNIPGRYVPIYGYERSNFAEGGGHRNVFFSKRGHKVNPSDHWYSGRDLEQQDSDPDTTLYPWLKEQHGALTAAHTPVYSKDKMQGTWTYNDPQVEPVAEIFQAFRRSYERPDDELVDEASVWYALRKGYRLGFIASSDHISTHMSYACVWAVDKTRDAIFDSLASRRTYAATDRIMLDVRVGGAMMGEETEVTGEQVAVAIRAVGTLPIREIEIVRSGQVIGRLTPDQRQVDETYVDSQPLPGQSYYYARLIQHDGGQAWGSPVWVSR